MRYWCHMLRILGENSTNFHCNVDGARCFKGRMVVPKDGELRCTILIMAHASTFSMQPGGTKMYRGLKDEYNWVDLKKDMAKFVSKCMVWLSLASIKKDFIWVKVDRLTKCV
ncbi:hypothetical protein V6N12_035521 [Hibiscus sabdariffa]|uniref:Integrase zinc-binding domain-containing protein n=1 Tax=Hibiscus sabdariffa TaxID=183260 RepID=A0ABR2EPN9_9ROSI